MVVGIFDRAVDHEGWPVDADGERAPWSDLTSVTARGRVYQEIVRSYRVPRATPDSYGDMTSSAPDWAWMTVRAVLEHASYENDCGQQIVLETMAWVTAKGGDAEARASRILTIPGSMRPTAGLSDDVRYMAELRRFLKSANELASYLAKK